MNYTPLDQAYKIHHSNSNTYEGTVSYNPICIYCTNTKSKPLIPFADGGSFRQCVRCKKNFRANIITEAVQNYRYSTHHLTRTY